MTEFEELCSMWNADAFCLRWQMERVKVSSSSAPMFNSTLSRVTGFHGVNRGLEIDYIGTHHPLVDYWRMCEYANPTARRVLYVGNRANIEVILGVYLWWLTKRGIISA